MCGSRSGDSNTCAERQIFSIRGGMWDSSQNEAAAGQHPRATRDRLCMHVTEMHGGRLRSVPEIRLCSRSSQSVLTCAFA
eukprot:473436-Pleurochrysis_carterae.AAC.2